MTEVLRAVLDYAFDRVGFNRVQAEVFYGNDSSSAVLKKCGMVLEGVARQKNIIKMVGISDTALWAIIPGDGLALGQELILSMIKGRYK